MSKENAHRPPSLRPPRPFSIPVASVHARVTVQFLTHVASWRIPQPYRSACRISSLLAFAHRRRSCGAAAACRRSAILAATVAVQASSTTSKALVSTLEALDYLCVHPHGLVRARHACTWMPKQRPLGVASRDAPAPSLHKITNHECAREFGTFYLLTVNPSAVPFAAGEGKRGRGAM